MKVAYLHPVLSRRGGGIPAAVIPLAEALAALPGITPELFAFEPPEHGATRLRPRIVRAFGPTVFPVAPGLGGTLRAADCDVLHTHGLWSWASIASRAWARRTGRPLIVSPHGMLDPWALAQSPRRKRLAMRLFERDHLERAACLHALTDAEAQAIRAAGFTAPIVTIPNGASFRPPETPGPPPDWMRNDGRRVLLFLGRLHPKKGVEPLIAAWSQTVTADPTIGAAWRLAIAGWDDGGHLAALRRSAAQSGAGDGIHFCGPLHGAAKAAALAHAGAFILPSFSEGLPMAVLEAWSFGRPVFATPACNLPEGIATGAAFPITTDPANIAAALSATLHDADRLAAAGAAGRRLVAERFAWPGIAARWRSVYAWAAGRAPVPETVQTVAAATAWA